MSRQNLRGYLAIFVLFLFMAIAGALEAPPFDSPPPPSQKIVIDSHGEPQLVANR